MLPRRDAALRIEIGGNMRSLCPLAFVVALLGLVTETHAASITFSDVGTSVDIADTVNDFRSALGTLNPNVAGSFDSGRREINWDGVPDARSAPNLLPADFFNVNSPRGVVFSTPGTGFEVSANAVNPTATPIEFGDIDPAYPGFFTTFSPQRLFTAVGSNIVDVNFFVPGSSTPAFTNGFGAVFTDVDLANISSLQFFDLFGNSLGTFFVPNIAGNETLSFLGVLFNGGEQIGRVRITAGNQILASGNTMTDLVVLDDFIYGEPQAVPEPAMAALMLGALGAFVRRHRRR
jgi:hypothetical protein